jgi:5'-phosphate synthase pdxT subunit
VPTVKAGVLALQGDFREHAIVLAAAGASPVEVRTPEDLAGVDLLVIPGGESTTMGKLARAVGLVEPVRSRVAGGMPVFGTCAGMIVLDRERLGLIDVDVERNAFGRQVASFETPLAIDGEEEPFTAVFIRAPWIVDAGSEVAILAEVEGHPVLARQGRILVASFHPELTDDTRVHERFLQIVREEQGVRA